MNNRGKLSYPSHVFKPEDYLTFIELSVFTKIWTRLDLTDDDLFLVQLAIMCDPQGPPVIPGTNGVRKLRFVPEACPTGKRDGMRCCFRFFSEHKTVVLALVYPKSVQENISADDKKRICAAIGEIAIRHRLTGPNLCLVGVNTGLLAEAVQLIRGGEAESCLCVSCDVISPALAQLTHLPATARACALFLQRHGAGLHVLRENDRDIESLCAVLCVPPSVN